MEVYNKNRDNNKNIHDEIREQNAKLKGAPLKDKLIYFKDYYLKTSIAVLCGVIFVIALIHSIVSGPDDTVFAAYFFNDTGDSGSTLLQESFAEYMEIDTNKHDVYIDATLNYYTEEKLQDNTGIALSAYDIYNNLQKTMAMVSAKDLDIIAGDEDTINYFAKGECLAQISDVLSDELMKKYEDKIYYFEGKPFGIIINDAPKIKEHHYYDFGEGILGFVVNSKDLDNAVAFLEYIFAE